MPATNAALPDLDFHAVLPSRRCDLLELWIGYALILVVIWTPRPWQRVFYFIAATFIVTSTCISFPGWKTVGLGSANLARSAWIVTVALLAAAIAIVLAARIHTLHAPGTPVLFLQRFAGYILFACVQQALVQVYFLPRLLRLTRTANSAALAAAAIFSLAHLPNPILTVITLVWGLISCMLFLRYRNLYPLAITHAILGITVAICVPGPTIHNMRVGLGYLTYSQHIHRRNP
jgi:hypothetical protein